uniref:MARVEL domain-containing protein n=1 Tax=Caenorhabditis tropicalis TaxID=1561998 RepID=A0A1I7U194_9PELO
MMLEKDALVCSFTSMPSGMFGLQKFLLNLSLMVDIVFVAACLLNYVSFHVGYDFYAVSVSFVHVGAVVVCCVILLATINATYGLLVMNLGKLCTVLFIWFGHLICAGFFLVAVVVAWIRNFNYDPMSIQQATCQYTRIPNACDVSLDQYLAAVSAFVIVIAAFKCAQILCLRALCVFSQEVFQYVDCETVFTRCLTEPDRRRRQAARRAQRGAQGNNAGDESESDEEDVVVFERVPGRYPGVSTIKDNSIT